MPRPNQWQVCSYIACPEMVQGSTRCPDHTVKQPDHRPTAAQRGYNWRWQQYRKTYITEHPWCAVTDCTRKATDIDHIDNQGPLGLRGYDSSNLRPLCHEHHSAKTAATTHATKRGGTA